MTVRDGRRSMPLVAVGVGYRSVPILQLAEAAAGVCDLLLVVDGHDPTVRASAALFRRFGHVVDVGTADQAEAVERLGAHHPDGLVAYRDEDLVRFADLAHALHLPFHSPAVALRLVDKWQQRAALARAGVPVPPIWRVPEGRDEQWRRFLAEVTYPCVLKPRRGSGSWHTFFIGDETMLTSTLAQLSVAGGAAEDLIVEGFLPSGPMPADEVIADYLSVESMVIGGEIRHLTTTGRLRQAEPFRETGFFIPSCVDAVQDKELRQVATAAIAALGVEWGCVHTEIKLTPEGPRVIEVNGRMGGGVDEMLSLSSDVDLMGLTLRQAAGDPVTLPDDIALRGVAYRFFYQPPVTARRIEAVAGLDRVGDLPGVDNVSLHLAPGDPVDAREGTRSFVFSVLGRASDYAGMRQTYRRMLECAGISYAHVEGSGLAALQPIAVGG